MFLEVRGSAAATLNEELEWLAEKVVKKGKKMGKTVVYCLTSKICCEVQEYLIARCKCLGAKDEK